MILHKGNSIISELVMTDEERAGYDALADYCNAREAIFNRVFNHAFCTHDGAQHIYTACSPAAKTRIKDIMFDFFKAGLLALGAQKAKDANDDPGTAANTGAKTDKFAHVPPEIRELLRDLERSGAEIHFMDLSDDVQSE